MVVQSQDNESLVLSGIKEYEFLCEHCSTSTDFITLPFNSIFECTACGKKSDIKNGDYKGIRAKEYYAYHSGLPIAGISTIELAMPFPPPSPVPFLPPYEAYCQCGWKGEPKIKQSLTEEPSNERDWSHRYKRAQHCLECDNELSRCEQLLMREDVNDFAVEHNLEIGD